MKRIKKKTTVPDITILRDTREKLGYSFEGYKVVDYCLTTGDYSIEKFENIVVVERKRLFELYINLGKERDRFMREVERMKNIPYRFLIIEGNLDEFLKGDGFSKMSPSCLLGSLVSLMFKHNIHVIFASNYELGEQATLNILTKAKKYLDRGDIL